MTNKMVVVEDGFTDWFASDVEPIRIGVYQVRSVVKGTSPFLAKWTGYWWCDAVQGHCIGKREWRGLNYHEYKRLAAHVSSLLILEFAAWC